MRNKIKWVVAGSSVIAVAAMMSIGAGAVSGQTPVASIRVATDHALGGVSGADQAAVSYVDTNYPGSGVANLLTTSADTEAGVPVYDVRIVAPNGSTYVVHVQQSNDAVLSANLAENQVTTPPVTTPPVATPPVIVPPVNIPTVITPSEPVETEVESGGSVVDQNTGASSGDTQGSSTTSGDSSAIPGGSSNVNTSVGTQGSPSSSDGSGNGQGVSTSGTSGSPDSGIGSTTNSDG